MLSKDLQKAEQVLRQAYANPKADSRVRQNLGLVVGLQGRFAEAETIVKADLPPDEAAANVAYLRGMLKGNSDTRASARNAGAPLADMNRAD
jgi:Flp pilus assembly protein TadD